MLSRTEAVGISVFEIHEGSAVLSEVRQVLRSDEASNWNTWHEIMVELQLQPLFVAVISTEVLASLTQLKNEIVLPGQ